MLDDRDRRLCQEIEASLAAEDPAFARRMRAGARPRRFIALVVLCAAFYLTTLIVGLLGGLAPALVWAAVFLVVALVVLHHRRR